MQKGVRVRFCSIHRVQDQSCLTVILVRNVVHLSVHLCFDDENSRLGVRDDEHRGIRG